MSFLSILPKTNTQKVKKKKNQQMDSHPWRKIQIDPEWNPVPRCWGRLLNVWCLPALPCFCVMSWQQSRRVCSDHQYWCCPMCRSGRCSPSCCRPNYRGREAEEKVVNSHGHTSDRSSNSTLMNSHNSALCSTKIHTVCALSLSSSQCKIYFCVSLKNCRSKKSWNAAHV